MKDLTKGFPAKVIIAFAIPMMLSNTFQQLYNFTDSKIVSCYVDSDALAAVGATSVVINLFISLLSGVTQGFAILIAKAFGAKDMESLKKYEAGTISLTSIITVLLVVLCMIFMRPILKFLDTPADIFEDSIKYVNIIISGLAFCALYNMTANMLRAVGDSIWPLISLVISVVLNIGIDLLFVAKFHMGIEGAAYATVLSQAISAILCLVAYLKRMKKILPTRKDWKISKSQLQSLLSSGFAMGMMGCIVCMGTVILQGAINGLGTTIVTAHITARRVFDLVNILIFSIGSAMTTYVSQNYGAKKYDRIKEGIKHAQYIVFGIEIVIFTLMYFFVGNILSWVASTKDTAIIDPAILYMYIGALFSFALGPLFIFRCSLQGMERKIIPITTSVLELIFKASFAYLFIPSLGYFGVAITEPVSWMIMTVVLFCGYIKAVSELSKEGK